MTFQWATVKHASVKANELEVTPAFCVWLFLNPAPGYWLLVSLLPANWAQVWVNLNNASVGFVCGSFGRWLLSLVTKGIWFCPDQIPAPLSVTHLKFKPPLFLIQWRAMCFGMRLGADTGSLLFKEPQWSLQASCSVPPTAWMKPLAISSNTLMTFLLS